MDVVYILGNGSRWYNYEIKYSLRSIIKHAQNVSRVIIVGEFPEFFNEKAIHIPKADGPLAQKNIWDKVLEACNYSEKFLFVNDDHFVMEDFSDYPYYQDGLMSEKRWIHSDHHNPYFRVARRTMSLLKGLDLPEYHFDIHCPMVIQADKFRKCYNYFTDYINSEPGIIMKSTYCNFNGITGEMYPDLKIKARFDYQSLRSLIKGRKFFSMGDVGSDAMLRVLNELYPLKTEYEQ